MSKKHSIFFENTIRGLQEAIQIEQGKKKLRKREEMPAPTYYVEEEVQDESNKSSDGNTM